MQTCSVSGIITIATTTTIFNLLILHSKTLALFHVAFPSKEASCHVGLVKCKLTKTYNPFPYGLYYMDPYSLCAIATSQVFTYYMWLTNGFHTRQCRTLPCIHQVPLAATAISFSRTNTIAGRGAAPFSHENQLFSSTLSHIYFIFKPFPRSPLLH